MVVLNRKRLIIITTCVFVSVFAFMLTNTAMPQNNVVETVSLPVSGKTVIIDAGHGVPDERGRKF